MAEYGAISCQDTMNLMRGRKLEYATPPAITYTRCVCPALAVHTCVSSVEPSSLLRAQSDNINQIITGLNSKYANLF